MNVTNWTSRLDSVIQRASIALGYPQLRPKQYEAVKLFLEGNDVFVVLPTGSGKSLCYDILPCWLVRVEARSGGGCRQPLMYDRKIRVQVQTVHKRSGGWVSKSSGRR